MCPRKRIRVLGFDDALALLLLIPRPGIRILVLTEHYRELGTKFIDECTRLNNGVEERDELIRIRTGDSQVVFTTLEMAGEYWDRSDYQIEVCGDGL